MANSRISKIDWDIIDARVRSEQACQEGMTLSCALLRLVLRAYFPSLTEGVVEAVTDGPGDRGIDAVHIIEDDDHAEIFLSGKYLQGFGMKFRSDYYFQKNLAHGFGRGFIDQGIGRYNSAKSRFGITRQSLSE